MVCSKAGEIFGINKVRKFQFAGKNQFIATKNKTKQIKTAEVRGMSHQTLVCSLNDEEFFACFSRTQLDHIFLVVVSDY